MASYNPTETEREVKESLLGFYRGIVADNNDPDKAGRVRVRVVPFFDGVPTPDLPWAIYADSMMGGLANNGSLLVPEIDSHVFIFFENGDHRYPVYFASAPAIQGGVPDVPTVSRETDASSSNDYAAEYPHNKVIRTISGITIELDDTPTNERIHLYHPSGSRIEMVVGGKINIVAAGDVNITGDVVVSGDVVVDGISFKTHVHTIQSGSSAGDTDIAK